MRPARILKFLLLIWCAATPALAADPWMKPFPIHLGSHVLTIQGNTGAARLLLDGKPIAKEASGFLLDWNGNVGTVPTVALFANRSGASCVDGDEIIVAAPPGKPVVFDRVPTLGCDQEPKVTEVSDRLVIVIPADVSQEGSVHLFDAGNGLWKATDLPKIGSAK